MELTFMDVYCARMQKSIKVYNFIECFCMHTFKTK